MDANSTLTVPGRLAAAFLSSSIAVVVLGILVYVRGNLTSSLEIYPAAGTFGGIWLYSYLFWLLLWGGLYLVLRRREVLGTLPFWVATFLVATLAGILIAVASFEWRTLFQ